VIREMKIDLPGVALARLCSLLGVTRQAYHQFFWRLTDMTTEEESVVTQVIEIRQAHRDMGVRKLLTQLQTFMLESQIKMGRDALFDLLAAHNLLVKRRRVSISTTFSRHRYKKYPSLILDWHPEKPNQLWVSDITYVRIKRGFIFLSLISDAYSHKIMGYSIAENMEGKHTLKALQMALKNRTKPTPDLIHHSDRGMQYCSAEYTGLLRQSDIKISMTQTGDPLENAVAERLNGIVKNEYLRHYKFESCRQADKILPEIIELYNCKRPHLSIEMRTPQEVHEKGLLINRTWERRRQRTILTTVEKSV
jgi:putative transposase